MIFHFLIVESIVNVSKLETDSTIVKRQRKFNILVYMFLCLHQKFIQVYIQYIY